MKVQSKIYEDISQNKGVLVFLVHKFNAQLGTLVKSTEIKLRTIRRCVYQ